MDYGDRSTGLLDQPSTIDSGPPAPAPVLADVAIVGAGLSGALLALVLARKGVSVAIIDVHRAHQADFRCEKLSANQISLLQDLGVLDAVQAAIAPGASLTDRGFRYDELVHAVRAAWPASIRFMTGRVMEIAAEGEHMRLASAEGDLALARLAVLATGPSPKLAARLGFSRRVIRDQHSLCIGFSLKPASGAAFPFTGLIRHGERAGDKIGFASLFPFGAVTRVNLFSFHNPRDAWVRAAKRDPLAALLEVSPGVRSYLADAEVVEPAEVRVTDLYRVEKVVRPGVVLIGDAFQTACPATALGVTKLLTDIRQLAHAHLPGWLGTPGMGAEKIAAFYADPIKAAVDAQALRKAATGRSMAVETGMFWRFWRLAAETRRRIKTFAATRSRRRASRLELRGGDWVKVRSAREIVASLDAAGRLDGLPFMPEMVALCGQSFQVHRRADKTCVEGHGLRRMRETVLLSAARCGGGLHDGCERGCLMFWKEAWLRPTGAAARPLADPAAEDAARQFLLGLPVRDGDRYLCQSTALAGATLKAPHWDLSHLAGDLWRGEIRFALLVEILLRTAANMVRKLFGLGGVGAITGCDGKARTRLDLQPGAQVRVKPLKQVAATLDKAGMNRGLSFEPEMAEYAGRICTVAAPVKRIIHEQTGRMVQLTSTVALEGVDCQGRYARNCPRSNPLYWREAWLEPADK